MQHQRTSVPTLSLRWLARGTSAVSIALILLFFVGFRPSQVALGGMDRLDVLSVWRDFGNVDFLEA